MTAEVLGGCFGLAAGAALVCAAYVPLYPRGHRRIPARLAVVFAVVALVLALVVGLVT